MWNRFVIIYLERLWKVILLLSIFISIQFCSNANNSSQLDIVNSSNEVVSVEIEMGNQKFKIDKLAKDNIEELHVYPKEESSYVVIVHFNNVQLTGEFGYVIPQMSSHDRLVITKEHLLFEQLR